MHFIRIKASCLAQGGQVMRTRVGFGLGRNQGLQGTLQGLAGKGRYDIVRESVVLQRMHTQVMLVGIYQPARHLAHFGQIRFRFRCVAGLRVRLHSYAFAIGHCGYAIDAVLNLNAAFAVRAVYEVNVRLGLAKDGDGQCAGRILYMFPLVVGGLHNQQINIGVLMPVAPGAGAEDDDIVRGYPFPQGLREADRTGIRVVGRERMETGIQLRGATLRHVRSRVLP